jgi:medium-chain acyl-[acyl-carrier-protein] hydrolase
MSIENKSEIDGIWTESHRIRSYEVDFARKLTIEGVLRCFQEAAWNHAEHLQLGYSHLRQSHRAWVLSRMTLQVHAYPDWNQPVTIRTWPRGSQSLFALRDFEMLDQGGRQMIGATSGWVVIDMNSRRPQRIDPILGPIRIIPELRAIGADPARISGSVSSPSPQPIAVKYSDLDLNDHVNNASYVRWMLDSYPIEFHRRHRIRSLVINFLAEVSALDSVALMTREVTPLQVLHTLTRQIDGSEVCRAEVEWVVGSG